MTRLSQSSTSVEKAYWSLAELVRDDSSVNGQLFALTWLAAGRMTATRSQAGVTGALELVDPIAWHGLVRDGLPTQAVDLLESFGRARSELGRDVRHHAASILADLTRELGLGRWDILPSLTDLAAGRAEGTVIPELVSLAMDVLAAPAGSEVWIPFDPKGQLSIEALRRGWHVLAASPLPTWPLIRQLVLAIETGSVGPEDVGGHREGGLASRRADYALVVPPFGVQMKEQRLHAWHSAGTRSREEFPRSESWAVFEFAHRINRRALFLTPQSILFAKGNDQKLREHLLHRGGECNEIQTVVALPPGVFGGTAVAGSLLLLNFEGGSDDVHMVDLGSSRRSLLEAGQAVAFGREAVLGEAPSEKARMVTREEIEANEFSFAPSRYLRKVSDLGEAVATLGEICELIRPPAITKEPTLYEVVEVGLPDLRTWKPISGELDKTVFLKAPPKSTIQVRPGDIVICIKGSVGKAGLIGDAADRRPTVVSQSCVALRLSSRTPTISPEVLLMYLRSPLGQEQLRGLQVGTGVQHISPVTLTSAVSVPIPSYEQFLEIRRDFSELCDLEQRIRGLEHRMTEIAWDRWPVEAL